MSNDYLLDILQLLSVDASKKKLLSMLVDAGGDVNRWGLPLNLAAANGDLELVKILLDLGADINQKTRTQQTPLLNAINWYHPELAEYLILQGADVNVRDEFMGTPLMRAVSKVRKGEIDQYFGVVKLLLEKGAEVNVRDHNGTPLLFWAV